MEAAEAQNVQRVEVQREWGGGIWGVGSGNDDPPGQTHTHTHTTDLRIEKQPC